MKRIRFEALMTKHWKIQVDPFASKFSLSLFRKVEDVEIRKWIVVQNSVGIRLNNQQTNWFLSYIRLCSVSSWRAHNFWPIWEVASFLWNPSSQQILPGPCPVPDVSVTHSTVAFLSGKFQYHPFIYCEIFQTVSFPLTKTHKHFSSLHLCYMFHSSLHWQKIFFYLKISKTLLRSECDGSNRDTMPY